MNNLDVAAVNNALNGSEWLAIGNCTDTGFNLVQLDGVPNDGSDDLDLHATTDALPVMSARLVSEGIKFILATADARSSFRELMIRTISQREQDVKMAA